MARILFGWELGDGLGHVMRLLPLARRLRDDGHEAVFAVRNLGPTVSVLAREGFPVVQAPYTSPIELPSWRGKTMASLGDVLATIGFADPNFLEAMVAGWQGLIDLVQPQLVVADFSPTLCLATYGTVPTVLIGDFFTLPPPNLPSFARFRQAEPRVSENLLLDTVREVQRRRGRPAPPRMPALFEGAGVFIATLPELDHFAASRKAPPIGPLEPLPPPVERAPEADYFAYLSVTYPGTAKVIDALVASPAKGSIYLRDAPRAQVEALRAKGLTIYDKPVSMPEVAGAAAVVIHHGGLGTTETVMALGRPQLLVPRHLEQQMNGHSLGRMRIAAAMKPHKEFEPAHVQQALNHLLTNADVRARAQAKARDLVTRGPFQGVDLMAAHCRTLLAQGAEPERQAALAG